MVLKRPASEATRTTRFENDVKMYGTQATNGWRSRTPGFENDVKMYGTQAVHGPRPDELRLRMM